MCYCFLRNLPPSAVVLFLGTLVGCAPSTPGIVGASRAAGNESPVMESAPAPKAVDPVDAKDAPKAASLQVTIDNFAFSPRKLTVAVGAKVTWVNHDDVPHTATSRRKPRLFDSGTLDTDDKYSHVFKTPGTYEYFCAVHPHMTGEIIVKQP